MNRSEMCQCSTDERLRRVLMVRRLHPAVTMQSLLQTFGAFGSITGCKVFTHKSGRSAGCASVEFASHAAACAAFRELQGTQLQGKNVHLQWFDHALSASPSRTPGQHMEMAMSPIAADSMGHLAGRSNNHTTPPHQPATPHSKAGGPTPHMAQQSPFGMLASTPHNPMYCNGAAVAAAAAAQQQQLVHEHQRQQQAAAATAAALLSSSGRQLPYSQQQQQLAQHRQVSAPLSSGLNQMPPAALHIPCSPHPRASVGTLDALFSPGPASANLSAAMAAASIPMAGQDSTSNLVALHHLAALQQQQQQQQHQLACLALQQMSAASHCSSQQQDFPLSPVRALQHHQQQQQQAFALAAALHNQQQVQQQQAQLLQHQLSGQLQSPAAQQRGHSQLAKLQLARSMPAALGSYLGGNCSPGNQGQLHSSSVYDLVHTAGLQQLQQQQNDPQNEFQRNISAPGSAGGALPTVSPFAFNQTAPGTPGASDSGSDRAAAAGVADPAAAAAAAALGADAGNESTGGTEADTVPISAKSLRGNNKGCEKYNAKKQLFRDEDGVNREHSRVSQLPTANYSRGCVSENGAPPFPASSLSPFSGCMQHGSAGMLQATGGSSAAAALGRASKTDDTGPSAADIDVLAAAVLAGAGAASGYPMSPSWAGNDQAMDLLTPELLASFNQAEPVPCSSPFMQNGSTAAAAAASLQQQQLVAAAAGMGSQSQLHQQRVQYGLPLATLRDAGAAGTADELALHLAHVRVKGARASDSQVLLGSSSSSSSQRFKMAPPPARLSSPSLPGTYGSPAAAAAADTAAAAAAMQAWQQAMLTGSSSNHQQQQQQLRSSCSDLGMAAGSNPATEEFKHKHKQQLQLKLPEYDMASAPLTSSHVSAGCDGFDQQLITTEVMPESPAAALHSPLDVHAAAMMVAAAAAGSRNAGCISNSSSGGFGGGSSWGDWSSMAALLSPVHVSSLAGRRFADFCTGADAARPGTKAGMMGQQQQLQGHGADGGWLGPRGSMGGMLGGSAGRSGPGMMPSVCEQQQQGSGYGNSCALGLGASSAAGQHSRGGFGMTRHSSLCLDAHPQLLPFDLGLHVSASASNNNRSTTGANCANGSTAGAGAGGGSSCREMRASSPGNGCSAGSMQLKRGLMLSEGGGALHSSGSFTFQPPVLLQQQQQSRLVGSGGSSIDSMITEPFQMPAFFRESAPGGSSVSHQAPPPGSPSQSTAGGATGAASGASMPLPLSSVMECSQQQQQQECGECQEPQLALTSPVPRQLHHSFSMPARFGEQECTKGLLASPHHSQQQLTQQETAAASPHHPQQQLAQQEAAAGAEQETPAGYGDVFRSLWGSNGGSSL